VNPQKPEKISDTTDTKDTAASTQGTAAKRGLSRRALFRRTAAATGTIALAGGGAVVLATSKKNDGNTAAPGAANSNTESNAQIIGTGTLREYWIQADSFSHNVVPNGYDAMTGSRYTPTQTTYVALGYRAYTPNWGKPLPGDDNIGENSGIPGPVLRAEVGDTIRVHFRNNDTYYKFMHSMHAHGLLYTPANDGTYIAQLGMRPGTGLMVGQSYTYEWKAVASSVGSWPYHDHSMGGKIPGSTGTSDSEMNASSGNMELGAELGLFGMIVITDDKTPKVDQEFILCFQDLYEADIPQLAQDLDCFNGHAFLENTPTFRVKVGQRIRWRVMALGTDFHVFHLHGHRWQYNGRYDDSLVFGPATTLTFDYIEDNPGTWLYHCHVTDHMMGGMIGYYISQ
jgi:FtsP/CotA-like multicopper oxidase with cupredoxin domain